MKATLRAQYGKLNAVSQVYASLTSQVAGNDILLRCQVPGKHHSAQKGLIRPKTGFFAPLLSLLRMLYSFKRVRCNSSLEMDFNSVSSILIKVSLQSSKHYLSVCLSSVCVHMCAHVCTYDSTPGEVGRQPAGVSDLPLPCGSQGSNSGPSAWVDMHLHPLSNLWSAL